MHAADHPEVRPLLPADWTTVRAIYLAGIATGTATFETEAPDWTTWDAAHLAVGRLVAEIGGVVAGWTALSPVSRRWVYRGVAEVSVYVDPAHRGRGVGRQLLDTLVRESWEHGFWTLQAGIFPDNEASIALHLRAGFRIVGRRERIAELRGVWKDNLLLERRS